MTAPTIQRRRGRPATSERHRSWRRSGVAALTVLAVALLLVASPTSSDAAEPDPDERPVPVRPSPDRPFPETTVPERPFPERPVPVRPLPEHPLPQGFICGNWPPLPSNQFRNPVTADAQDAASETCGQDFNARQGDRCDWINNPAGWRCMIREPNRVDEQKRQRAVDQAVGALESYSYANGTYNVSGSGRGGSGEGWFFFESFGANYPTSIASQLDADGHFPNGVLHDPLWRANTWTRGDVMVYRCENRVAVFTREGNGEPSEIDSAWWNNNGCNRYPIDELNATYYKVSSPLPSLPDPPIPRADEVLRWQGVDQLVKALESYGRTNDTYLLNGSGFQGRGSGWVFYQADGSTYPVSVASLLKAQGHLPDDLTQDPLWENEGSVAGDVLVYRCKDRVAVFTREGYGKPSESDSAWWSENGCFRYPIDRLNATYFKLSEPLP